MLSGSFLCSQQHIDFGDDGEGVGYVDDVGFAAGPAAVGVERDGAAVGDEAPADDVGLFTMTAGCKALGMARGCAGLADLIEWVRKGRTEFPSPPWSTKDLQLPSDAPVWREEAEDEFGGFGDVGLAVGLFLGPACAGDEEHFGVGADGLFVLLWSADAGDGGSLCRRALL